MTIKMYPLRGCDNGMGASIAGTQARGLLSRQGKFRAQRSATRALPSTRELLKKLDQNFYFCPPEAPINTTNYPLLGSAAIR